MESVLNEISTEMSGQAVVGLVLPEERKLFENFRVRMIPAIFIIRNAEIKKSYEGMVPKEALIKDLREFAMATKQ